MNTTNLSPDRTYECDDCGLKARRAVCEDAAHPYYRLSPGSVYTDKECHECGALMYPVEHKPGGHMSFSEALKALKSGKRIARSGWNGKGMFLFLLPAKDGIPKSAITDPMLRSVVDEIDDTDTFDAYGSIRMLTADKKIITGWLASQADLLSDDWVIVSAS